MTRRRSLLALLGMAIVVATPAASAPTWGTPVQISTGDRALGPELAANAAGDGLVVWDQEVGAECPTQPAALSCVHIVTAAARSPGSGAWAAPVEISRPGVGATPRAAIDLAGNAAIVWVHDIGRDRVLQATYRRGRSGSWPEPNDLSEARLEIRDHDVALDAAGNVVAVWAERAQETFDVFAVVRSAATGVWGAPVRLSSLASHAAAGPSVDVAPDATAVVAWIERNGVVRAARGSLATGAWEQPVDLSGSASLPQHGVQIAINAAGDTAGVWVRGFGGGSAEVQAAARPRGGSWGPPVGLGSARTASSAMPRVAVDASGNVVTAWRSPAGVAAAAYSAVAGVWRGHTVVSSLRTAAGLALTADETGNAVAVWTSRDGGVVQAAIRPEASGHWLPLRAVSGSGASEPRVAIGTVGNAVSTWNRGSAARFVVESADLAGGGPVLTRVTVPKRAAVLGARVRFLVLPSPWAAPLVGEPRWSFGDGSRANGRRVEHAYSRTGRFTVSVSQADAAGGVSTSTARVHVIKARVRNVRRPSIRGTAQVGESLTCRRGLWSGTPPIRFAYAWRRDGQLVVGATSQRYELRRRDAGSLIACEVVATNPARSARAISEIVAVKR